MGDERAETYLRLLAEAELRQGAERKVSQAGRILVEAGVLDPDYLADVLGELQVALIVRSRLLLDQDRRRGRIYRGSYTLASDPPPARTAPPELHATPLGATLRKTGPVPWTLHLLSLVRWPAEAAITVAMRMHWPPDGSAADLELTGPGPQHMPYGDLHAQDDHGARYTTRFEGGPAGTATWLGVARVSPVPPPGTRRLDLIGDGTRLLQVPLGTPVPAAPSCTKRQPSTPGDHLLVLEAERLLAGGGARGPVEGPTPGEVVTMLMATGAIATDSPVPGQLAALHQRLGLTGHGITVPPSARLPAPWSSVLDGAPGDAGTFVPLACVLPEIDGTRFALAGLSTSPGDSHLHVISSGRPELTDRSPYDWTQGFSWWLRDDAGDWHLATPGEAWPLDVTTRALTLRLTPPLAASPAEITVTGPTTQTRATLLT